MPSFRLHHRLTRWRARCGSGSTLATVAVPPADRGPAPERILYILDSVATAGGRTAALQVIVTRPLKSGGMGAGRPYDIHNLTHGTAKFLTLEDALIGQLLTSRNYSYGRALPDDPAQLDLAFRRMVATGRCHYRDKDAPPLAEGPERPGRLTWSLGPTGEQRPTVEVDDPACTVLPCAAPWYVDPAANVAGPLAFAEPPRLVAAFLDAPPVAPEQGEAVRQYLASRLPGHTLPPPREEIAVATITDPPVPSLRLTSERVSPLYRYGYGSVTETVFDLALLGFDYGGTVLSGDKEPNEIRYAEEGRILVRRRDRKAERAARKRLEGLGFVPAGILPRGTDRRQRTGMALAGDEAAWHRFLHREVPALEAEGWRIETDPGFRHRVVEAEGDWEASLGEKSGWWFSLELGIDVEGERVPLLPVLAQAVRRMRAARDGEDLLQGETLYAPLPDGRTLALPTERVRPMLETLVELYDPDASPSSTSLDISLAQAAALAEVAAATRLRWLTDNRLLELIERLRQAGTVEEADAPEGLNAELRPYQRRGVDWLRFLGEPASAACSPTTWASARRCRRWPPRWPRTRAGRLDGPRSSSCPTSVVSTGRPRPRASARPARRRLPRRRRAASSTRSATPTSCSPPTRSCASTSSALGASRVVDTSCSTRRRRSRTPTARRRAPRAGSTRATASALTGTPVENRLDELWSCCTSRTAACSAAAPASRSAVPHADRQRGDAGRRRRAARAHPAVRAAPHEERGRARAAAAHRHRAHVELDGDERAALRRPSARRRRARTRGDRRTRPRAQRA